MGGGVKEDGKNVNLDRAEKKKLSVKALNGAVESGRRASMWPCGNSLDARRRPSCASRST